MKKIISKVLVLAMLVSLFASYSAFAGGATANGNNFEIVSMSYLNEEGETVIAPWSNGKCTVAVTLKRIGTGAESAALIGALYADGNKLISADSQEFEFAFPGVKHDYLLNVQFPENVEGCELKLYLWNSEDGLAPIGSGSVFSTVSNNSVENIWVNGKALEGFSTDVKEYNLTLPVGTVTNPEIYAECADLSTKITTEYGENEDGSKRATVIATSNSGVSDSYVINYTVEQPAVIAQLVYDYVTGTKNEADGTYTWTEEKRTENIGLSQRKLLPPDYQYDEEGNMVDFGDDVMSKISTLYNNPGEYKCLYVDVPDELKGAEILHLSGNMRNNNPALNADGLTHSNKPYDFSDMVVRLTLNKSATFYFPATKAVAQLSGATRSTVSDGVTFQQVSRGSDFKVPANYINNNASVQGKNCAQPGNQGDFRYELFLEVPAGETKTFEIPIVGTSFADDSAKYQWAPIIWLKWADDVEEELEITNITYTGETKVGGSGTEEDPFVTEEVTLEKEIREDVLAEPKWNTDENGNPVKTVFVDFNAITDGWERELEFSSKVTRVEPYSSADGQHHFYTDISEELLGAKIVSSRRFDFFNKETAGAKCTEASVTFTINKDATLYYYDEQGSNAAKYGAELMADSLTLDIAEHTGRHTTTMEKQYDPDGDDNDDGTRDRLSLSKWLYKLELVVPEGQESQTFTIKLKNPWATGPILLFK